MIPRWEKWNPLFHAHRRDKSISNNSTVGRKRRKARAPAAGTFERLYQETRAGWHSAKTESIEDYRFAVFGDQWKGFDL
jgi:hypothetical protein